MLSHPKAKKEKDPRTLTRSSVGVLEVLNWLTVHFASVTQCGFQVPLEDDDVGIPREDIKNLSIHPTDVIKLMSRDKTIGWAIQKDDRTVNPQQENARCH